MTATTFNTAIRQTGFEDSSKLRSGNAATLPADEPGLLAAPFQPLDPGIVSEAIPGFFIGRDKDGFWIARDVKGKIGGIFLFESSALAFAKRNSQPTGCATIYLSERVELDLANSGNRFVRYLRPLMKLAKRGRQRPAAFISN